MGQHREALRRCRAAGAHLPDEELKALQVGKVAEEAGEAMHALHGLKSRPPGDALHRPHGRPRHLRRDPPSSDAKGARGRRRRPDGLRMWLSTAPVGRGRRPRPAHKLRRAPASSAVELSLLHQGDSLRSPRAAGSHRSYLWPVLVPAKPVTRLQLAPWRGGTRCG